MTAIAASPRIFVRFIHLLALDPTISKGDRAYQSAPCQSISDKPIINRLSEADLLQRFMEPKTMDLELVTEQSASVIDTTTLPLSSRSPKAQTTL